MIVGGFSENNCHIFMCDEHTKTKKHCNVFDFLSAVFSFSFFFFYPECSLAGREEVERADAKT